MTVTAGISIERLVAEAEAEVETLSVEDAVALLGAGDVVMIDLRDVRELEREGRVPGAFHMPRGMLEFWIDPQSPYYKSLFDDDKRFVFYCNKGWRSALAARTAQDMGLQRVSHVGGGFEAWTAAGGAVEAYEKRRPARS